MSAADKTTGYRFRAIVNAALEDSRRKEIQTDLVNVVFSQLSGKLETLINHHTSALFNSVARIEQMSPPAVNPAVIQKLTLDEQETILPIPLPINTAFTDFTAGEINEMTGYIALHQKARELDVSLRLIGLTDDTKAAGQVVLVVELMKSYEDGALEYGSLYPDLPPPPVAFDKRRGGMNQLL